MRSLRADQHQPTCSGGKFVMIRKMPQSKQL